MFGRWGMKPLGRPTLLIDMRTGMGIVTRVQGKATLNVLLKLQYRLLLLKGELLNMVELR